MVPGKDYRGRVIITRFIVDNTPRLQVRDSRICVFPEDVLLPRGCAGQNDVVLIRTPENYREFVRLTNWGVT